MALVVVPRVMVPSKQKAWSDAIDKEEELRLVWFQKNKERLQKIVDIQSTIKDTEAAEEALKQTLIETYRNAERHTLKKVEIVPPVVPPAAHEMMKPVDPVVRQLIYKSLNKDGRVKYLTERAKLIPEQRYYIPECTSYQYGWNMWYSSLNIKKTGFGRRQVVRESFYRRRGTSGDPAWYKEPAKKSPTICN